MTDGPTRPPIPAERSQRHAASRKRRLPLWLLLVPVVLVAAGIGLLVILGGDGGAIIGGGGDGDEEVPEFAFAIGRADAVATASDPDVEALEAEADTLVEDIAPIVDDLYTNAFLDPANWRDGDYAEVLELFSPEAASAAEQSVETLTLGATAGEVFERVTPRKGSLRFTVLFDPAGAAHTAVARVRFSALGERSDGTFVVIVSDGELFLRDVDGWMVTAFDVTRDDHETTAPPASPAPSGTIATPSA